jgi:hypothetical protein
MKSSIIATILVLSALLLSTFLLETHQNAPVNETFTASETHTMSNMETNLSKTISNCVHPSYGEFNIHNIELMTKGVIIPPNKTVTVKGVIFAKEYTVKGMKGFEVVNETKCYYSGKVKLKAFIGEPNLGNAWRAIQRKLEETKELEIEIIPSEVEIFPQKNATFKIRISAKNAEKGRTYYIYLVAFGEEGWKSWEVLEVKIWNASSKD